MLLLAGVVVNVAVAWGCLLAIRWPNPYQPTYQPSDSLASAWWHQNKPEGVTEDLGGFEVQQRLGWRKVLFSGDANGSYKVLPSGAIRITGDIRENCGAFFQTAGLPIKSLHGQAWYRSGKTLQSSGLITTVTPSWLPLLPVWPGFAINTLFYAVVLWLVINGPLALRRAIRRQRGLCPACAYPMGESRVCSECGKVQRNGAVA